MKVNTHHKFSSLPVPKRLVNHINFLDEKGQKIEEKNLIQNLSKVNIVVGANNSGKSLLCREILKTQITSEYYSNKILDEVNQIIQETKTQLIEIFKYSNAFAFANNNLSISQKKVSELFSSINESTHYRSFLINAEKTLNELSTQSFHSRKDISQKDVSIPIYADQDKFLKKEFTSISKKFRERIEPYESNVSLSRIYVPTYRSLKNYNNQLVNEDRINHEYSLNIGKYESNFADKDITIQTGERFYRDYKKLHNSGFLNSNKLDQFQQFLSENFFDKQHISIIPNEEESTIKIKIGSEEEQPIHNLGDGLQAIILITFQLFSHEAALMVVEEPELYIHPAFQKKLIKIFSTHKKADDFILFFVTHSNHIMEAAFETSNGSLISIDKVVESENPQDSILPSFNVRTVRFGDRDILATLGVSNNSVFQSNCLFWVEGITDKMYLETMLKKYWTDRNKNEFPYFEGKHYSFVFTGGDSIVHYNFEDSKSIDNLSKQSSALFICSKSFVIVDKDHSKNPRRKRALKEKLGINFYELPVVEIENLLSPNSIKETILSYSSFDTFELTDLADFAASDYGNLRLGTFIDEHVTKPIWKKGMKRFSLKDKTDSTINDKVNFCTKAVQFQQSDSLTKQAEKVAKQLLRFIEESNK